MVVNIIQKQGKKPNMPVRDLSPDKKEVVNILWKCGEKKMQEVKSQKMS